MDTLKFGPEDLVDLIERLRLVGFKVGAGQHINAQNLLALLASRGRLGDTPHGLKTWLAPVLCNSPEEQATFYELFEKWAEEGRHKEQPRHTERGSLLRNRWLWGLAAVATGAAIVLVVNYLPAGEGGGPGGTPTPTPGGTGIVVAPSWTLSAVLGILALVVGGWWLLKLPRAPQLVRWRAEDELPLERLSVKGIGERLFGGRLHGLRRHRSSAPGDVDINSTVDATARNAGWFTPVYAFRRAAPEYLLMIDRAGFGDQLASFGEALRARLEEEGVNVARYFFKSDPRLCRGDDPTASHLTLEDLTALHPEHDLIIFGDGEGLLDPLTGQPASWLSHSPRRPKRVLLTPLPQSLWGHRERALAHEGFEVIPANGSGLARLAERVLTGVPAERERAGWRPRYPEALKRRPERWLIDEAPAPEAVKRLCFQLRLFLGAEAYQWLCSCAVYPLLLWDLTLHLGQALNYRQGFEESLAKLVQLPWFRHGFMPDWLRLQLVSDLESEQEQRVRQALSDLLVSCADGVCDVLELEILLRREEPQARRAEGNKILHDYVEAHPESRLRDYVLLTFMSGRKPERLAVDVPAEVLERLRPARRSGWLIRLLDAVLLAEAYFVLLITTLFPHPVVLPCGLIFFLCNIVMVFQLHGWDLGDAARAWRSKMPRLLPEKRARREERRLQPEDTVKLEPPVERHPAGLYVLSVAEMFERFSFYSMLAIFVVYMRDDAQGFGWSVERTVSLYTWYLSFVYLAPLVGGFIGDWKLGHRRALMVGGLFFSAGYGLLSYRSLTAVYAALVCLVVGNGFFKPNVSVMVGNLYPEGSRLKDRAYCIFYMGINVGALIAPALMEIVVQTFGYHAAFAAASSAMVLSLLTLWLLKRHVEAADMPAPLGAKAEADTAAVNAGAPPAPVSPRNPIDAVPGWKRVGALAVIFSIVMIFWAVSNQNGSAMAYWVTNNIDWNVAAISPFSIVIVFVLLLALPLVGLWAWLDRRGLEPSTPTKLAVGMMLNSAALFVLYFGASVGEASVVGADPADYRLSPWWLVGAYGLFAAGELMLLPVGLALVSKVAPRRWRGVMMGVWFAALGFGYRLTQVGDLWNSMPHSSFWFFLGVCALATALVLLSLMRPLRKAMPGV